jgi:hypothetical protein
MYTITLLRRQFEQVLSALLRQPRAVAVCRAGRNRTSQGVELLCRDFSAVSSMEPSPADGDRVFLALARTNEELRDSPRIWLTASPAPRARALTAFLTLGVASARGQLSGAVLTDRGHLAPLHALQLIGAGMYQFRISDGEPEPQRHGETSGQAQGNTPPPKSSASSMSLWQNPVVPLNCLDEHR